MHESFTTETIGMGYLLRDGWKSPSPVCHPVEQFVSGFLTSPLLPETATTNLLSWRLRNEQLSC